MADHGAELLALVHAHPDVDDHRLVYADWLQQSGDPRGEFIMLQFKRAAAEASDAELSRERELFDAHGREWLGRLGDSFEPESVVFRKGFLAEATARQHAPEELSAVRDAPEWATLERLAGPADVLALPGLRAMWSVGPMHPIALTHLRSTLHRVREALMDVTNWGPRFTNAIRDTLPGLLDLEIRYPDSYSASWNDFQPALYAPLLAADKLPTLRSLLIRQHVLMPFRRWRDFTEARPDLHAWALLCRQCTNDVHSIRLEPCRGWHFTMVRPDRESRWSLDIDWHTASASADIKTLELAIGWLRRSDFAHFRVRIHDFARPAYQRQLRQVMNGIRPLAIELVAPAVPATT